MIKIILLSLFFISVTTVGVLAIPKKIAIPSPFMERVKEVVDEPVIETVEAENEVVEKVVPIKKLVPNLVLCHAGEIGSQEVTPEKCARIMKNYREYLEIKGEIDTLRDPEPVYIYEYPTSTEEVNLDIHPLPSSTSGGDIKVPDFNKEVESFKKNTEITQPKEKCKPVGDGFNCFKKGSNLEL